MLCAYGINRFSHDVAHIAESLGNSVLSCEKNGVNLLLIIIFFVLFQILQCTDSPKFDVDWLTWNHTQTHLALWGQLGITVLELPQKWGKFAEFHGGKDNVTCK